MSVERDPVDDRRAGLDALGGSVPGAAHDEPRPRREPTPEEEPIGDARALQVLRRGLAVSPELKVGVAFTIGMAVATAAGRLVVPVLIQQILDRGILGAAGFRPGFVYPACAVAVVAVVGLFLITRATYLRLIRAAENTLFGLRVRTFAHIHRLSIAEHNETRRGALVARVTSDIETLARFVEWGAVAWIVDTAVIVGTIAVMAVYSWQLALLVVAIFLPLIPIFGALQRRQLAAYDRVRNRVGETLSEVSETITGAGVIRAYGLEPHVRGRLGQAIQAQYRANIEAARWFALMFPLGDLFGTAAMAAVAVVGAWWGPGWGLDVGKVIAFLFLVNLLLNPIGELSEIVDQTQTAIAGWRKVLAVLALPVEVADPEPDPARPVRLPDGPLGVGVEGVRFAYRDGTPVLHGIDVTIPAGASVAVVGETGSGKTTFVKLLCRLADPTEGRVTVGGVDLRDLPADLRQRHIRLVPQDGFLFDTTIVDNVRFGRPGATDADVAASFDSLGLGWWLDRLPDGPRTRVGERGAGLSVGERQLVALARAQLSDPGLLLLDEATSSLDPETEQALAGALARLAEGRTTVSVAHRLATAEHADLVLVFDAGRIVEIGHHGELLAAGGVYSRMFASWLGNTRTIG